MKLRFHFFILQKNLSEQKAERLIIDEFERSLLQIIQMANKSKGEIDDNTKDGDKEVFAKMHRVL